MRSTVPRVEPLESRIAPAAVYFLSGTDLDVFDEDGNSVNVEAAQTAVGSTIAVLLQAGDKLVLDVNGNRLVDAGEETLVHLRAGSALVFATDLGASPDPAFDAEEITGLAVSDGVRATISVDVNGSIVTALNADGSLAFAGGKLTIQRGADIAGLNITGNVAGNIYAGGSISNVRVSGAIAGNIATGSATTEAFSVQHLQGRPLKLDGSAPAQPGLMLTNYIPLPGEVGGDISDIRVGQGVNNLIAGNGSDGVGQVGSRGGSVSRAFITQPTADPVWIYAGDGGTSNTAGGGRGGDLAGISVRFLSGSNALDGLVLQAGAGGDSGGVGNAGRGGSILDTVLIVERAIPGHAVSVLAGSGGFADGTGSGGLGGSISFTSIQLVGGGTVKRLVVDAGAGGGSAGGAGAAGGNITNSTVLSVVAIGDGNSGSGFDFTAGNGGTGATRGGAGGLLQTNTIVLKSLVHAPQSASIRGGNGGDLDGDATANAVAGRGGGISGLSVTHLAEMNPGLTIAGGVGGSAAGVDSGKGGAGGSVSASVTGIGGSNMALFVIAGDGGDGGADSGTGGAGGSVSQTTITENGTLKSLTVQAGAGGDGIGSSAAGGAGGALNTVEVTTGSVSQDAMFISGAAGKSNDLKGASGGAVVSLYYQGTGDIGGELKVSTGAGGATTGSAAAGKGGNFRDSVITQLGALKKLTLLTGDGGASSGGKGGAGGGVLRVVMNNIGTLSDTTQGSQFDGTIKTGTGGAGTAGGAGGFVNVLTLRSFDARLLVQAGAGGAATASRGGAGGELVGIAGSADFISLVAGAGGNSTGGAGGLGGGVRAVQFADVTRLVHTVAAGDGGGGNTVGGRGGSISRVSVPGDIGDFTKSFDITSSFGMGGIAAGQAGSVGSSIDPTKNGSISQVDATRIATMIAGRPAANKLSKTNTVLRISKITAEAIGADVLTPGIVDHVQTAGDTDPNYNLDQSLDTLLDGIVLVRIGGLRIDPAIATFNVIAK